MKALREENYIGVIRLKENNKSLIKDAEGLFKIQEPREWKNKRKIVNTNIYK